MDARQNEESVLVTGLFQTANFKMYQSLYIHHITMRDSAYTVTSASYYYLYRLFILVSIPCPFLKTIIISDICASLFIGYCQHFNPLNAKLNPICHLLALLGAHPILHISRIRVNFIFIFNHLKSLICLLPQFLSHYLYVDIHFNSVMFTCSEFCSTTTFQNAESWNWISSVTFNLLTTKRRLLYLKTQFVPHSKPFSSRL